MPGVILQWMLVAFIGVLMVLVLIALIRMLFRR